jgi:hypothetical protein
MVRLCCIFLALGLVLFSLAPVAAATPIKIQISGGGLSGSVEITDPQDLDALIGGLCTDKPARDLAGHPAFDIAIEWTPDLVWHGQFYPTISDGPAAIDIPDWTLYQGGEEQRCNQRIVASGALEVLARYGVPTRVNAPSSLPDTGISLHIENCVDLAIFAVLLLLIGLWESFRISPPTDNGE